MACTVVYGHTKNGEKLVGKKFQSHAAVARKLKPGECVTVQENSGTWEGWYRQVGVDKNDPKNYWVQRRPAMEY